MSQNSIQALARLPRTLQLSPSTRINREHLVSLYKEQIRVAETFSSYNFKQYFLRRTKEKFRSELPPLLGSQYSHDMFELPGSTTSSGKSLSAASTSSDPSSSSTPASSSSASSSSTDAAPSGQEEQLRKWYEESLSELAVMARAALVNQMYEAPRLVVEGRGNAMATGGGGAGAEASYGGAGQPANPNPDKPATPVDETKR